MRSAIDGRRRLPLFELPTDQEKALEAILDLKRSTKFLSLAKYSIEKHQGDLDADLIATIFDNTLQIRPCDRSLSNLLSYFGKYRPR